MVTVTSEAVAGSASEAHVMSSGEAAGGRRGTFTNADAGR